MRASAARNKARTLFHRPRDMPMAAGATSFSRLARSRASAGIFSGALLTARTVVRIADAISCLLRSGRLLAYSVASRSARLGFEKRGASTGTRSSSHNRKKSESAGEPAAYGRSSSTFTESPLRNFSLSRALIPFSSSLNVFTKCLDDGRSLAGTRVKTSAAAVKCFLSGLAIKISRNCFTRLLIFYLFLDCL
jgi:hypothetical protein